MSLLTLCVFTVHRVRLSGFLLLYWNSLLPLMANYVYCARIENRAGCRGLCVNTDALQQRNNGVSKRGDVNSIWETNFTFRHTGAAG